MRSLAATFLFTLAAAGCGVNKQVHQKALDDLNACQGQVAATQKKSDKFESDLNEANAELSALRGDKKSLTEAQREAGARITKLSKDMKATEAELVELRRQRDAAQKRIEVYRKIQDRMRQLVDTGKLKVEFRKGQMVLKLPSEILFASGQAKLSKGGETALIEVAQALKDFKDRRLMVAGHTDNVPVKGGKFKNNWALSTARAVSVVDFMIDAGFPPENLAAAGYSEFDPVSDNASPSGKLMNRRIEIIFVPDLSELPTMSES